MLRTFLGPVRFWVAWTVIGIAALTVGLVAAALTALAAQFAVNDWEPELSGTVGVLALLGVCMTLDRLHLLPKREDQPITLSLSDCAAPNDADPKRFRH